MDPIEATRTAIAASGVDAIVVDDLTEADLPHIRWSGPAIHLRSVRTQLQRVAAGQVEYLAARAPGGRPVGKAGIDYAVEPRTGVIWQVAVHDDLHGLGLGTRLIVVAEQRARAHGCTRAALSVEHDNPRARALYERLGYEAHRDRETGWPTQLEGGREGWYTTWVTDLRKPL